MTMTIAGYNVISTASIWYDAGFKRYLEGYMGYLRQLTTNQLKPIDAHTAYKYEGDFYGLLQTLKLEAKYHWAVMRINDYTNPAVTLEGATSLILPDFARLEKIRMVYQSLVKKRRY